MLDGGYFFTASSPLTLAAEDDEGVPARAEDTDLGELALSGRYVRLSGVVTF